MGHKMKNAPIYYALAQVRFNAVLALEQYVPAIQDSLRKVGFTDYQRVLQAMINLTIGAGAPPPPNIGALQPVARHLFLNEAKTAGFSLDQSMLMFHTTDYDTFDAFSDAFRKGVEIVHSAASLSYSERIGLRFLDAVCPNDKEGLSAYLTPSVLGLFDKLAPRELVHVFSETRTKAGNATLVSRAIVYRQDQEGAVFPQDLQPVPLELIDRFKKVKGLYAVIDTDSWLEEREKFSLPSLDKRLLLLHDDLRKSFDLMVTPHALKTWE